MFNIALGRAVPSQGHSWGMENLTLIKGCLYRGVHIRYNYTSFDSEMVDVCEASPLVRLGTHWRTK